MNQSPPAPSVPMPPDRAALRAERRRLRMTIRAKRAVLKQSAAFEKAEERRAFAERVARDQANRVHQKALAKADQEQDHRKWAIAAQLQALDHQQQKSEAEQLKTLRRQFINDYLRRNYISAKEINGLGTGLINDLAAQGIRTAAGFTGFSRGPAPNGKGGDVIWFHLPTHRKVHVNGIGEHRARALDQWRKACQARAEDRAPKSIGFADKRRIEEATERRRVELRAEETAAEANANEARAAAKENRDGTLARIAGKAREAESETAAKRAQYAVVAQELARLEEELSSLHAGQGGMRFGRRPYRQSVSKESAPTAPKAVPPQRQSATPPAAAGHPGAPAPPKRQSGPAVGRPKLLWLVPIVFYFVSAPTGTPVLVDAPLWTVIFLPVGHVAVSGYLFFHWVLRVSQWKKYRSTTRMPAPAKHFVWVWLIVVAVISSQYE